MIKAGVVAVNRFVRSGSREFASYIDYLDRNEAVRNENFKDFNLFNDYISEYLPKLDSVLTEIVNSDACMGNKTILENFRDLMIEPEQKEIKVTDLFKIWKKRCEKEIDTCGLDIDYDGGVSYSCVECEMSVEELGKPSWSSTKREETFSESGDNLTAHIDGSNVRRVLDWKNSFRILPRKRQRKVHWHMNLLN